MKHDMAHPDPRLSCPCYPDPTDCYCLCHRELPTPWVRLLVLAIVAAIALWLVLGLLAAVAP